MSRLIKWILGLFGLLLGLVIVAIIAVVLLIDPNDYREQIANVVEEQTGRELRIDGEIKLSLFPWLGLELGQLELGNAAGFAEEPFAGMRRVDLRVKLLPLLRMRAEVDTIVLHGMTLNLHCLEDGLCNWDDLAGEGEEVPSMPAQEADTAEGPLLDQILADLAIGGIEILDANISWRDDQAGLLAQLRNFNLRTGAISLQQAIPLQLDAAISLNEPALEASIDLNTRIALDLGAQRYLLDATRLLLEARSELIPGGHLKLSLSADLAADLEAQTAVVKNLLLQGMGLELAANIDAADIMGDPKAQGNLRVELKDATALSTMVELPEGIDARALAGTRLGTAFKLDLGSAQSLELNQLQLAALGLELDLQVAIKELLGEPQISGSLSSNEFVPRQLLTTLGVELPEMADPNTLILAQLGMGFDAGLDHASLKDIKIRFDQSNLSGSASVRSFEAPIIRYQFDLDEIDADRYLPPPSEEEETTVAGSGQAAEPEEIELPLELLRSLDIDGSFRLGKVKVMNLHSSEIHKTLRAEKGLFRIHPIGAQLYGGIYGGDLRFDVRQDTPKLSMDEQLNGVQAGPLLKDFMGEDYASGKANLAIKASAEGLDPMQVRRTLNGSGSFSFEDGQIKGLNIGHLLRQGYALYKKQDAPAEETRQTDFTALRGSFTIRDGLVNTSDLSARSPVFQIAGKGSVNLVSEQLDMRLDTTIISSLKDAANQEINELRGLTVPITIKGSFADPKIGVDVGGVLRARLEQAVDEKKRELQQRLDAEKAEAQRRLDAEKEAARLKAKQEEDALRQKAREEEEAARQRLEAEKKKREEELKDSLRDRLRL